MHSDEATLLRAVLAQPEDDVPRLVLADWWEEHGQPERGEFCRLQCEIARLRAGGYPCFHDITYPQGCEVCVLRKKEQELWTQHGLEWFPEAFTPEGCYTEQDVRRGFVAHVRCPLAAWLGEPCECVESERQGDPDDPPCPSCRGTGSVGGVAAAVCGSQPVEAVTLSDREPADRVAVNGQWYWFRNGRNALGNWSDASHIPDVLFDRLDGATPDTIGLPHPTRQAALDTLSAAALAVGRGWAKLGKSRASETRELRQ